MSVLLNPAPTAHRAVMGALRDYLGDAKAAALERSAARLDSAFRDRELAECVVLTMFGGGKDSSFATAAARYMQLSLEERRGETFLLRVCTNRHPGMPIAVMRNIDRVYRALELDSDPKTELLLVDGDSISAFDAARPLPESLRLRDRLDILMNGHRCQGDPRPTFCNRCNLSMENALALAIGWGKHADMVLTGDSPTEQRHYLAWVRHASRRLGNRPADGMPGLRTFLHDLDQIGQRLSSEVFGEASAEVRSRRLQLDAVKADPLFFSIYEDTTYRAGDHWRLLTEFLGFEFDEIAFSFTESDCGNPGEMAHINGLRHERLLGSDYATGIQEYKDFAIGLMRRKEFPEYLINVVQERYATPSGIARMRRLMDDYARVSFHISEEQLVCMIFSPFTDGARHLRLYLESEKPALLPCEGHIRGLLSGELDPPQVAALDAELASISGLDNDHRRTLFRSPIVPTRQPGALPNNPISIILSGDPHKALIDRRVRSGEIVHEYISGR